jgi:hypothetical protein
LELSGLAAFGGGAFAAGAPGIVPVMSALSPSPSA